MMRRSRKLNDRMIVMKRLEKKLCCIPLKIEFGEAYELTKELVKVEWNSSISLFIYLIIYRILITMLLVV